MRFDTDRPRLTRFQRRRAVPSPAASVDSAPVGRPAEGLPDSDISGPVAGGPGGASASRVFPMPQRGPFIPRPSSPDLASKLQRGSGPFMPSPVSMSTKPKMPGPAVETLPPGSPSPTQDESMANFGPDLGPDVRLGDAGVIDRRP